MTSPSVAAGGTKTPAAASVTPAFYEPENYKPEESVAHLMRRILGSVSAEVQRQLDSSGLTNAQWVPLFKLSMGHASTVAELARECNLDAGGMTRLLDRLEGKGLVRRVRSTGDRRVVNLELTDEGRAAAKQIPEVLCGVQNAFVRGFTAEEHQQLKALLRRMLDNAKAMRGEREAREAP